MEHYCPNVPIEKGDIIDGGVLEWLYHTIKFLKAIGDEGFLYGFEPNYMLKEDIEKGLKDYKNAKIYYEGLWSKNEYKILSIGNNIDSSFIWGFEKNYL